MNKSSLYTVFDQITCQWPGRLWTGRAWPGLGPVTNNTTRRPSSFPTTPPAVASVYIWFLGSPFKWKSSGSGNMRHLFHWTVKWKAEITILLFHLSARGGLHANGKMVQTSTKLLSNEWMNECLTTPQHEKQIGYWVSEKGKCMKWLYH